jgi:hypothetical protein
MYRYGIVCGGVAACQVWYCVCVLCVVVWQHVRYGTVCGGVAACQVWYCVCVLCVVVWQHV